MSCDHCHVREERERGGGGDLTLCSLINTSIFILTSTLLYLRKQKQLTVSNEQSNEHSQIAFWHIKVIAKQEV